MADHFIEDIRNNMSGLTSVDYDDGLSGIDAGFKYLLEKGFIDGGIAELAEKTEQTIYNSLINIRHDDIHNYLYQITRLGKYFMLGFRKRPLLVIGPLSDANRRCVSHMINLLGLVDVTTIPGLDYRDVLRVIDFLSLVSMTVFREKEVRQFLNYALQGLEATIFGNPNFKPFHAGCNPFSVAVVLLQTYNRTGNQDFASTAIRILLEYEGTINDFYTVKDIRDIDLLLHVIACKKLHTVLMDDSFDERALECLDFYGERKNNQPYNDWSDPGLRNGYSGEGMALLTLDGLVEMDWLEDWVGYY